MLSVTPDDTLRRKHQVRVCACLVFDAYKKVAGCDIEESIKDECTGNLEKVLLAVGKRATQAIHTLSAHLTPVNINKTGLTLHH